MGEQCGGTVCDSMVEQCGTVWWNSVEWYGGTVEQCGRVWWYSVEEYGGTVEQYGRTV